MNLIDTCVGNEQYDEAIHECIRSNHNYLGLLISYSINDTNKYLIKQLENNTVGMKTEGKYITEVCDSNESNCLEKLIDDDTINVKLLGNWGNSEMLREQCKNMCKTEYRWNNIEVVTDDNPDYYVVFNSVDSSESIDKSKTIVFQTEPFMDGKNSGKWGEWSKPDPKEFFKVVTHKTDYNPILWNLNKTYTELQTFKIDKTSDELCAISYPEYIDIGDIKMVDFLKYLDNRQDICINIFGSNKWGFKNYKSFPDNKILEYKYIIVCEKESTDNYITHKIIDGILSECLVFYFGCGNVREFLDNRSFIQLGLSNYEKDCDIIRKAIDEKMWEQRIGIIRSEKMKILNYLQFFPHLERIINKTEGVKYMS